MKKQNFEKLIQAITGRDFKIRIGEDVEIQPETEYLIFRTLPITKRNITFYWKTPKTEDKFLRSFITSFTTKYREPNPNNYRNCSPYFSPAWDEMEDIKKEYAYFHHYSNMYSKEKLLKQVEGNFGNPEIEKTLLRYGFYNTEYGVGIFCFWETEFVVSAINKMKEYLKNNSIPFVNEFSDARWVFRFKLNITKEIHASILESFYSIQN